LPEGMALLGYDGLTEDEATAVSEVSGTKIKLYDKWMEPGHGKRNCTETVSRNRIRKTTRETLGLPNSFPANLFAVEILKGKFIQKTRSPILEDARRSLQIYAITKK
jgi:hypothetical protein